MAFEYVLSDLAGSKVSELPGASEKKCVPRPVGTMGTASVKVPLDHPDADFLLEADALLRVYDTGITRLEPIFHGRLVTAEEAATADARGTVACTFADAYWMTLRRLIGKSAEGYSIGAATAPVDIGTIIADIVDLANAEDPSGLRMGDAEASSSTYVEGWQYAPAGAKIAELGATLDGPDWQVRAIEYDGGYYGELDVRPSVGGLMPNAVFEYGEGGNVKSYRRGVSLEGTANRVFHLPAQAAGEVAPASVIEREDAASQAARGLMEDVVSADLTVDGLRAKLLEHHIAVRHGPRQTITFEPAADVGGNVPRFGRDFDNGDIIPFRATYTYTQEDQAPAVTRKRIDGLFRIYQTEISVDDVGAATYGITVTPT